MEIEISELRRSVGSIIHIDTCSCLIHDSYIVFCFIMPVIIIYSCCLTLVFLTFVTFYALLVFALCVT